jgi:hypothetical protein
MEYWKAGILEGWNVDKSQQRTMQRSQLIRQVFPLHHSILSIIPILRENLKHD